MLASELLDQARTTKDPQHVFAYERAVRCCPDYRDPKKTEDPEANLKVGLELLEKLTAFLDETDPAALRALQPHLRPFAKRLEAAYAR